MHPIVSVLDSSWATSLHVISAKNFNSLHSKPRVRNASDTLISLLASSYKHITQSYYFLNSINQVHFLK